MGHLVSLCPPPDKLPTPANLDDAGLRITENASSHAAYIHSPRRKSLKFIAEVRDSRKLPNYDNASHIKIVSRCPALPRIHCS
jgi:hypothetical protein